MHFVKGLVAGIIAIAVLAVVIPRGDDSDPAPDRTSRPPRAVTVATTGNLAAPRTSDGMPVFTVSDVSPGTIVEGTATIANSGGSTGYFSLSQANLVDSPGPGGSALSERLGIEIRDVTRPGRVVRVYDGPFAGMEVRPLGFIPPGETRRYAFTATVAEGQGTEITGSSTSARYVWSGLEGRAAPSRPVKPRDRVPPALGVRIPRVQRLLTTPYLSARVTCSEDCRLSVTGGIDRRLRAGRTTNLRIRIPRGRLRAFRSALRDGRAATLRVTFRARDAERNRATVRRTVRLRPRRP